MSELSRLRWLCRRGMKELDVVMTGYLENYYSGATESDQQSFKTLLEMQDPDLFALLVGRSESGDQNITEMVRFLKGMTGRQ